MAFDGLFTHALVHELQAILINGRVTKISAPYKNEIILTIRNNKINYPLLLSAHPNYARAQITHIPYTNPQTPSNFTMVLRKYLESAKLVTLEQLANDRVLNLSFVTRNELGDKLPLVLSLEIMGRYSNLILLNQETGQIIDTIKHVGMDQNRYRTLLPNAAYRRPPMQNKINLFENDFDWNLLQQFPNREVLAGQIVQKYQGFSKNSALILADMLHQKGQAALKIFLEQTLNPTPTIFKTERGDDFTCFNVEGKTFASLSEMLDHFYRNKATKDRVMSQGARMIHVVKNDLARNRKKLKKLQQELKATENADSYRVKGELLTTYLYQVKKGMASITLNNYYDQEKPVKITLSNQLSPSGNAQKYFKKYQKLKNAIGFINQQLKLTQDEITYLETIQAQIELANPSDLPDIKAELEKGGYLTVKKAAKKRPASTSKPDTFIASDGTKISVGKNNFQNDKLTLKTARKDEYWLHVKNIPGSHVIIHNNHPSQNTLTEAAQIAAYYSKARTSANVAVDYVQVKHIRKPNGAKPGFVIYEGQKTLYVTPIEAEVLALKA
ncbi:Predicted component of the ribosome quality control (RQC) complex, YloA/Tae2 family, contains fibronectin-binding (FbpA) and DUF814 domains [Ligilactobacillus sp. WC1T17]|uniref:Rqc2 homolog RqcH n=1 Tax=Ligilactobacillus ruminis TaxID=1623 RepID=A0ABY1AA79_9LACO|nr:Predicted component of the ribosome quality control (RQC) complex, YloA/Tae2 family, contains fibronectin-binding (FbpA) and DUF814 domains [Ligilactobacillus ruminis]